VDFHLTEKQKEFNEQCKLFAKEHVAPRASAADIEQKADLELVRKIGDMGYLGSLIGPQWGGLNLDAVEFGLLNYQLGKECSNIRSLVTVHSMVEYAILRWGSAVQKDRLLPDLAAGKKIGVFALSEEEAGSDISRIATTLTANGNGYLLNGRKKWVTYGQIADIYLVFAKLEGKPCSVLVERNDAGLSIKPIANMLGLRGSGTAEIELTDVQLSPEQIIGKPGFGLSHVALSALDYGKLSVAWGCLGIVESCLEVALAYAEGRVQFDKPIKEQQLIQMMLTDMVTSARASYFLCHNASVMKECGDQRAILETSIAKYYSSCAANTAAGHAVQMLGANGCSSAYPVERHYRDAKIMTIIEGSSQMQQIMVANMYRG
jgi:alkylation response protein AidB-like acyl-CoA dehydrogenase